VHSIAHFIRTHKVGICLMLIGAGIGIVGGAFGKTAAVIAGVLCFFAGISVLFLPSRKPEELLKSRTLKLANELFDFLRKQGPEPPNPLSHRVGSEADQRQVFNAYFDWKKVTYFKYMAEFKDRVVKIDYELAAEGIFTKLERREIDPSETSQEVDLKKIAETLLLVGTQIPEKKNLLLRRN